MTDRTYSFVYGRGETQHSRYDHALAPVSAQVDDRGLPEMLAWLSEFARLVGFVDEQGEPAGNWSRFLEQDESFLLAEVCATTVESLATGEAARAVAGHGAEPGVSASAPLSRIFSISWRIDTWYSTAARLDTTGIEAHPFAVNLQQVIVNDLRRYTRQINADRVLGPAWRRLAERANMSFAPIWSWDDGHGLSLSFDSQDLAPVQSAFERALDNLKVLARSYLESSHHESKDHAPQTGLLIAFVKLLNLEQSDLNQFTLRHLQHYLTQVLRLAPRPSQPDQALVAFALAPGATPPLLGTGTRLAAGVDGAGAPIEFATAAPLVVTPTQIATLMALNATYVDGGDSTEGQPLTSIVAYPNAGSADGRGAKLAAPALGWPSFGPTRAVAIEAGNTAPDAQVGFAIASPLLLLMGGERTITLSFELGAPGEGVGLAALPPTAAGGAAGSAPASSDNAYARLERLAVAYARALAPEAGAKLAAESPPSSSELLGNLLADACLVSLSGKDGWFAPQDARLVVSERNTLDLVIELSAAAPAVLANPALAFDSAQAEPLPLLRVTMNPSARVYGYSFFEALRALSANLEVQVRGLRTLELQNNLGPLVAGKPFMPFGPAPTLGGFLQVGSPELGCKQVSHIGLQIDWLKLPGAGGFSAYYRGYPPDANGEPLSRESFVVAIERNDGLAWRPANAGRSSRFALFEPAGSVPIGLSTDVAASTRFEIDSDAPVTTAAAGLAPATYAAALVPGSEVGALRVALAAPAGAFGYDAYSRALAEAVLHNSRAPRKPGPGDLVPIPNEPFVPVASALSLDYTSAAHIRFDSLDERDPMRFYVLAPFGYVRARQGLATRFVPDGVRGALFMGLVDASPGDTLSLLFQLADRHAPQSFDFTQNDPQDERGSSSGLVWHYLDGNRWQRFSKQDVLNDSTYGLTCSGIVELVLPAQLDAQSTLMPAGRTWLAAMVSDANGYAAVCDTIAISPNAVMVSRVSSGATEIANLQPQSISGLVSKRPAIKAVLQPLPSWGGLPAETPEAFAARVAERLRHKQRAIQPYDYERLVLGGFANIAQAKCIGPGNSRGYSASPPLSAGEVVVVVAARGGDAYESYVDQSTLRGAVDLLRPYVSPFLRRLTVRNPAYERLKVVAAVQLKRATSGTFYLNLLGRELDAALAPWHAKPDGRLPIGYGAIDGDSIASFIRQRDYVESLEEFSMVVLYNDSPDGSGNDWRESWFCQNESV
ncbi:MAG: baseplate J/gp47 family protein, partial [Paraburkholderia sp.]